MHFEGGLSAVAGLLLIPLLAAAQPGQPAPNPPQRSSARARPRRHRPVVPPAWAPRTPGGAGDRSAGAEKRAHGRRPREPRLRDVELAVVIDTIAQAHRQELRLRTTACAAAWTIISPSPIPVAQAFTVFESRAAGEGLHDRRGARRRLKGSDPRRQGNQIDTQEQRARHAGHRSLRDAN